MYTYFHTYLHIYLKAEKKRSVKIDHNLVELTSEDDGRMKN